MGIEWIIIILVMVLFLSGGIFPFVNVDLSPAYFTTASTSWHCEQPIWTKSPQVKDRHFDGTLELHCQFDALSGGGFSELRAHMMRQLPANAKEVHAGPAVASFEGLPSTQFELTVETKGEKESALIRGEAHIATDGFSRLRNVFNTTESRSRGYAKYVKAVDSEVDIVALEDADRFRVRFVSRARVAKPMFVSSKALKKHLIENMEDQIQAKAELMINDMAAHL